VTKFCNARFVGLFTDKRAFVHLAMALLIGINRIECSCNNKAINELCIQSYLGEGSKDRGTELAAIGAWHQPNIIACIEHNHALSFVIILSLTPEKLAHVEATTIRNNSDFLVVAIVFDILSQPFKMAKVKRNVAKLIIGVLWPVKVDRSVWR